MPGAGDRVAADQAVGKFSGGAVPSLRHPICRRSGEPDRAPLRGGSRIS